MQRSQPTDRRFRRNKPLYAKWSQDVSIFDYNQKVYRISTAFLLRRFNKAVERANAATILSMLTAQGFGFVRACLSQALVSFGVTAL
jgi:hypothetical protein